ncbi:Sas5p KNAG_0A03210 [Huiozyma naganishii CBS 8797]|uniref:YEATS domain-containing protein n=1 Tax=Huiozyma naganishii (strain ATCC MYA-139 / BCRC 22969 / CBS 8797 / KCTC 17520 / NBRC 10181 / NCYC 3082 / Yp74L-3) TaxID=1071383 RepID=J7REN8_HUIN7|nr:hypothetical protein KNAG_0A03210 [Kazachstania naganishii CBS 8797]CCK68008.1 hypothetical protein KNAG_0A03210 [Kazachstania naganishii CBS 8797]
MSSSQVTPSIEVTVRVKTQQVIVQEAPNEDALPLRRWQVQLCMLNANGLEVPLDIASSVTYTLHPSFETPVQKKVHAPFTIEEQGWGEFLMKITGKLLDSKVKFTITHDIVFSDPAYAVDYTVVIPTLYPLVKDKLALYFELPDPEAELAASTPKPNLPWDVILQEMDEDMVTELVQLILNDESVKNEVSRYNSDERVYISFGQFPIELIQKMVQYVERWKRGELTVGERQEEEDDDEEDIFGDNHAVFAKKKLKRGSKGKAKIHAKKTCKSKEQDKINGKIVEKVIE